MTAVTRSPLIVTPSQSLIGVSSAQLREPPSSSSESRSASQSFTRPISPNVSQPGWLSLTVIATLTLSVSPSESVAVTVTMWLLIASSSSIIVVVIWPLFSSISKYIDSLSV